ncbi:MAG: hypothetical protein Kow00124_22540 [Anaerolineae bacterium]
MSERWRAFLKRLAIALGLLAAANLAVMLFWSPAWFTYWQVPITCTIFIIFLGVTLFDTLFDSRSR